MSPTESRTGFRLPWSTDSRADTEDQPAPAAQDAPQDQDAPDAAEAQAPAVDATEAAASLDVGSVATAAETSDIAWSDRSPSDDEARSTAEAQTDTEVPQVFPAPDAPAAPASVAETTPAHAAGPQRGHRPEKFLADLTRAMQSAAEAARDQSLAQFEAQSRQFVDEIQARSAEEAGALRQDSEQDIAATREWSKAEMARIREETEARVSQRRSQLDQDLQAHGELVEHRIEQVRKRLEAYRGEMADFFEHLLAVDDPTRFARLAEQMPEPPSLEDTWVDAPEPDPVTPEPVAEAWTPDDETSAVAVDDADEDAPVGAVVVEEHAAETQVDGGTLAWPTADTSMDFGAAEAEAEAAAFVVDGEPAVGDGSDDPADDMSQAAVDARLAGLVVGKDEDDAEPTAAATTSLVVSGLVSVASIAAFKRQVARIPGVTAVTVSSGPDGEFVFAATHGASSQLAGEVAAFSGFEAQVIEAGDGVLRIAARDPEA